MKWESYILEKVKSRIDISRCDDSSNVLLEDLIDESIRDIVNYCHLDKYTIDYDYYLIKCVVRKWNKLGVEGVITRTTGDIRTEYESVDEIGDILATIPQIIRPVGTTYSVGRYKRPTDEM